MAYDENRNNLRVSVNIETGVNSDATCDNKISDFDRDYQRLRDFERRCAPIRPRLTPKPDTCNKPQLESLFDKRPLSEHVRELRERFGYPEPADIKIGFYVDKSQVSYIKALVFLHEKLYADDGWLIYIIQAFKLLKIEKRPYDAASLTVKQLYDLIYERLCVKTDESKPQ